MTKLERERAKLNRLVEKFGLGNPEVQKQSEIVDKLLNEMKFKTWKIDGYKVI